MPAPNSKFDELEDRLRATSDPAEINRILDHWFDLKARATEWDARKWGFYPNVWCAKLREEMEERILAASRLEAAAMKRKKAAEAARRRTAK